jgi:environmental stress-induced protein Ves
MQRLRRTDYKRMPWKNGQGITEEVMAFPPGSDMASFGWRISIAHVGADGPFSVFAGIDRTIALLDGAGLYLEMPDETVELGLRTDPLPFSGDLKISSRNKGGPTIDLNIMTRRGSFEHRMRRIRGGLIDIAERGTILVFNECGMAFFGDRDIDVDRFDALVVDPADGPLRVPPGTDVLVIEVTPLPCAASSSKRRG